MKRIETRLPDCQPFFFLSSLSLFLFLSLSLVLKSTRSKSRLLTSFNWMTESKQNFQNLLLPGIFGAKTRPGRVFFVSGRSSKFWTGAKKFKPESRSLLEGGELKARLNMLSFSSWLSIAVPSLESSASAVQLKYPAKLKDSSRALLYFLFLNIAVNRRAIFLRYKVQ